MSDAIDKLKHAAQDLAGKAKEATGKSTDDESLEAKGKADQTEASIKKTGDDVKDILK